MEDSHKRRQNLFGEGERMKYVCIAGKLETKPFDTLEEAEKHREEWLGQFSIFHEIIIKEVA